MAAGEGLLKIVNQNFFSADFKYLFHEFDVLRMHLVIVLRFFAGENQVQRHLVSLVHHRPMARRHSTDVKAEDARNRPQIFFRARDQFIRRIGFRGIRPENNNV